MTITFTIVTPDRITRIFADILYRQLATDIGWQLECRYGVNSASLLVDAMFVIEDFFVELVRAAEGVVRDLIQIFTKAAVHANKRGRNDIDKRAVLEAARQWYEQDKERALSPRLRKVLQDIISYVIGTKRARSFMIPRDLEHHPVVQGLFDARVLHLVLRGYADKDHPGLRYNVFSIDYGTYVDLMNTSGAPDLSLFEDDEDSGITVPFDDRRSIRRIILSENILGALPRPEQEKGDLPFGLKKGDKRIHPMYGVVTIEHVTNSLIEIVTEDGELKKLGASVALPKLRLLDAPT